MKHLEKLRAAAAILAQIGDGKTREQKARELGVSRTTLWRWSKKANVREELEKYVDAEFYALARAIVEQLTQRALAGNSKAIQLYLELIGMYDIGTEARIRRLIQCGVDPATYADWYRQITSKNHPTS